MNDLEEYYSGLDCRPCSSISMPKKKLRRNIPVIIIDNNDDNDEKIDDDVTILKTVPNQDKNLEADEHAIIKGVKKSSAPAVRSRYGTPQKKRKFLTC